MEQCFYIGQGNFQVPDEYDSVLGSNGFLVPSLSVERIGGGDYVIFEMRAIVRLELLDRSGNSDNFDALMPYKLLGQVIANAHTSSIYVGTFDGKPKFRPKSRVDELWQTIVELTTSNFLAFALCAAKWLTGAEAKRAAIPRTRAAPNTPTSSLISKRSSAGKALRMQKKKPWLTRRNCKKLSANCVGQTTLLLTNDRCDMAALPCWLTNRLA